MGSFFKGLLTLIARLVGNRGDDSTTGTPSPPTNGDTTAPPAEPTAPIDMDDLLDDDLLDIDDGTIVEAPAPIPNDEAPPPPITSPINPDDDAHDHDHSDCNFPETHDIPSDVSHADVPEIVTDAQAGSFGAQALLTNDIAPTFSTQSSDCIVTVRPELGSVNLRLGPNLKFEPPIAKTRGGITYELVGAAEPDENDLRWFAVKLGTTSGWIRSDLVNLSAECASHTFINDEDVAQPDQPPITGKFPLPVKASISQGYWSRHRGYDMNSAEGTALVAPIDGTCIRQIVCTKCTAARPNRYPNGSFQCPDTWTDPAWGYGYGNFMIVRHDYALLPADMQAEMDKRSLGQGFAYILYAHLSRMDVALGERFRARQTLGATGNTGCSTAPHLHFEVKIGNDESVDNIWSKQVSVNPKLMFDV